MNDIERPLVSIIIPVYNTEMFVERAIDSVLVQTYPNIEVILVNDGSTDESGRICNEYALKNNCVRVIHQKNSGVSVARNKGIDISTGKYIQFVDSDDEIKSNMTEALVNAIEEQDCDIVICGYSTIRQEKKDISIEARLYERNEFLILSYTDVKVSPLVWSSCNMMFKNCLLEENNLRFDSAYLMGEDGFFTLEYLKKCKKVFVLNQVFYNYYIYKPEERISTISYFTPDVYEFVIRYFERLFYGIKCEIKEQEKSILLQAFYDKLIAELVHLGAYSEYFSNDDLEKRLSSVVSTELVIQAGKVYTRTRKSDSIVIPLFMRWKTIKFLYLALKKRGKQYIAKCGKRSIVRSIYNHR